MNNSSKLTAFAKRYAQAWCSQDPENVAAFFAEKGSLRVNDGAPAIGRAAISAVAQGFMRDLPDMIVTMDNVTQTSDGTNTGPGGAGRRLLSGYELWKINEDGLIADSKGHFNTAEYERQLKHGIDD